MTRSVLARRLVVAAATAAGVGVLSLWWLGSQLVKPVQHAVPLLRKYL